MKMRCFPLIATLLCVAAMTWQALGSPTEDIAVEKKNLDKKVEKTEAKDGHSLAQETFVSYSYVGGTDMKQGNADLGSSSQQTTTARYVASPEIHNGLLFRIGGEWNRHSFSLPDAAPLPNTLQDISIILGIDAEIAEDWLLRVEAQPGIYSDFVDIGIDDFNMPLIVGATWLYSKDVQWMFGMSINLQRQFPVLPGAGVRWKFADQWVLNLMVPRPRLEFELDKSITLYGGLNLLGTTYRANENFANSHGRTNLNDTPIDYWEVRAGAGVNWKIMPGLKLEAEAGLQTTRVYNFHRANTYMRNDDSAPYASISLSGNF